jgi:organic radical activating enzyme
MSLRLIENMITWQGEGPNTGKRVILLRFKKCDRVENRKPCPYCDTLVKMRISAEAEYSLEDIQKEIVDKNYGILLTGGEPTYLSNFHETLNILSLDFPFIDIETNGYNLVELINHINKLKILKNINYIYSPKFFNIEELYETIEKSKKLIKLMYNNKIYFKIVLDKENNFITQYLDFLSQNKGINSNVYLMPKGKDKEEIMKNAPFVFDECEYYNFCFSGRQHIMYDFI